MDAGINAATHLGGQRCGDHEDHGDSTIMESLPSIRLSPSRGDHGGDEQMFGEE
jgi:hypothetical protein